MGDIMRAVVLFNKTDVLDYEKKYRSEKDIIIPIGPFARHYAIEQGWKLCILKELWTNEEYQAAKTISVEKIQVLIADLNNFFQNKSTRFSFQVGSYFHFFLHNMIGQIHYSRFILEKINSKLKPESWLLYYPKDKELFLNFWPNEEASMYEIVLNASFITNYQIIDNAGNKKKITARSLVKKIVPAAWIGNFFSIKKKIKNNGGLFAKKAGRKVLVSGPIYDWGPIVTEETFRKRYAADYWDGDKLVYKKTEDKELIDILNKSVLYDGKAAYDLARQCGTIWGTFKYMEQNFSSVYKKINGYSAVLSTMHAFPDQTYIAHLASTLDKPVICWQHGEMGLSYDPFTESLETKYSTHYFCYAPLVKSKYDFFIGKTRLKEVFSVGNSRKQIEWEGGDYILYATGKWLKNGMPFIEAQDPDTRLYEAQSTILSFLNKIGREHKVIVKGNNTKAANEFLFNDFKNITIEHSIPFTTLLKNAKMVILDSPSTTCIESSSVDIPMFVLVGRTPWYELPTALLKKKAFVTESAIELTMGIEAYLEKGTYPADPLNKEFFHGYGSSLSIAETKTTVLSILETVIK
jgi:hypothetical protein